MKNIIVFDVEKGGIIILSMLNKVLDKIIGILETYC